MKQKKNAKKKQNTQAEANAQEEGRTPVETETEKTSLPETEGELSSGNGVPEDTSPETDEESEEISAVAHLELRDELATTKVEVLALQSEVQRLSTELHAQQSRLDDTLRAFRKAQEEFDNTKDRLSRESEATLTREKARILEPLLDIADNLHLSLSATNETRSFDALHEGVEMVHAQFQRALNNAGLTPIDPLGQVFDPDCHEAMGVVDVSTEEDDKKVVEVLRMGYRSGEIVVRPALVQVGRYEKS